jgi:catechol 2,3-dioxygenase-like lactoylglutathione lyase family enzyme
MHANPKRSKLKLPLALGILVIGVAHAQPPAASRAQLPPVTGLQPDHATLSVRNLAVEAAWYQRVLGFKVLSRSDDPGYVNWHLIIPGYRIDLIAAPDSIPGPSVKYLYLRQGWVHVSFHVADVTKALGALQALHVQVTVKKDANGTPVQLRIHDPEGNEIEIRRNLAL